MNRKDPQILEPHYSAMPALGTGPGVLALHAWWGLNDFFKDFCERLAGEGFIVLAPDLYHGAVAETVEDAKKLRSKLKEPVVEKEIAQAMEHLQALTGPEHRKIGVVGFSLGGYYALCLADKPSSPVAATVVFYGTRNGGYTEGQSAYQFHFAEMDDYVTASGIKKMQKSLKAAGREAEYYTYPGTVHWFFEADCMGAYQAMMADLAWNRTLAFLKAHL